MQLPSPTLQVSSDLLPSGSAGDPYAAYRLAPSTGAAAAGSALAVTPSDTIDMFLVSRGVYVGAAGPLTCVMADGSTVTFGNVPGGSILPIRAARIMATGTTASAIAQLT